MSSYLFLFMIMGVAFAYVSVPNMIEITPSNADIFFGEGSNILVLFYRPVCPSCSLKLCLVVLFCSIL